MLCNRYLFFLCLMRHPPNILQLTDQNVRHPYCVRQIAVAYVMLNVLFDPEQKRELEHEEIKSLSRRWFFFIPE